MAATLQKGTTSLRGSKTPDILERKEFAPVIRKSHQTKHLFLRILYRILNKKTKKTPKPNKTEGYLFKDRLAIKNNKTKKIPSKLNSWKRTLLGSAGGNMPRPSSQGLHLIFFILPKSNFGFKIQQIPTITKISQAQKINRARYSVEWRVFF